MKCIDRNGNPIASDREQEKVINFLYKTFIGRQILKIFIRPWVSKLGGWVLSKRISIVGIKPFIKKNNIDISKFEEKKYTSYDDFFTRKIKLEERPIDYSEDVLISPCDSRLTVHHISKDNTFKIKGTDYTIDSLFRDKEISEKYKEGILLLFRLTVDDYHRYCYVDNGKLLESKKIEGVFHTVNPIAAENGPIYKENTREYVTLQSENFGDILCMEVGALMVGKIVNHNEDNEKAKVNVFKGQEKGYFRFGGSTIILCFEKDKITVDEDILTNSRNQIETKVRYGEAIGRC